MRYVATISVELLVECESEAPQHVQRVTERLKSVVNDALIADEELWVGEVSTTTTLVRPAVVGKDF